MPISRSTAGTKLLARHEYDNASYPFATGDWENRSTETRSLESGRLRLTAPGDVGTSRRMRRTGIAARSKRLIYLTHRVNVLSTNTVRCGAAAHAEETAKTGALDDDVQMCAVWSRGADSLAFLRTLNDPDFTIHGGTTTITARANDTVHATALFVDGATVASYDFSDAVSKSTTTASLTSGYAGFSYYTNNGGGHFELEQYFDCTDRYVTVTGIPTGGSAEVRKSDDTVLASASESSGTATVDMLTVHLRQAVKLVVKNSGGTVLATLDAGALGEIIEPGETYTYTIDIAPANATLTLTGYAPTVSAPATVAPGAASLTLTGYAPTLPGAEPVWTSPTAGTTQGSSVSLAWTHPNVAGHSFEIQYRTHSTAEWIALTTVVAGSSYSWSRPSYVISNTVGLRIRAVGSTTSGWVILSPLIFAAPTAVTVGELTTTTSPVQYWRFEQTSGNFTNTIGGGYTGIAGAGIVERPVTAICNGIRASSGGTGAVPVMSTDDGGSIPVLGVVSGTAYSFSQWVKFTSTSTDGWECLVPAIGNGGAGSGIYSLGLLANTQQLRVWLHGDFYVSGPFNGDQYWTDAITRYQGSELTANVWHHVVVEVEKTTSGASQWVTIRLYWDGVHCGSLSGTYTEFNRQIGQPISSGQPALVGMYTPFWYGKHTDNPISYMFGWPYIGSLDEAAWYNRGLGPATVTALYQAGLATLNATPAGAFTSPATGAHYDINSALTISWGAAAGATGYKLEVQYDGGAWSTLATTVAATYSTTLPATPHASIKYRVTPLFTAGQYLPEQCAAVSPSVTITSGSFVTEDENSSPAALCSLQLDVYADDRTTVLWQVSTDPAHSWPYLDVPQHYGEQEIDVVAGAASIGQIEVTVIDRQQTTADQDSGWLTARLKDGIHGRRCRLRRYTADGWVTVADGPAGSPRMDESYAAYRWTIRDTRDSERKTRAFVTGDTTSVYPAGLLTAFGSLAAIGPTTGKLASAGGDIRYINFSAMSGFDLDDMPASWIIGSAAEPLLQPTAITSEGGSRWLVEYGNLTLKWRVSGSGSYTTVVAPTIRQGLPTPETLLYVYDAERRETVNGETVTYAVRTGAQTRTFGPFTGTFGGVFGTVVQPDWLTPILALSVGTVLDIQLLANTAPSEGNPLHISGLTAGSFLQNLYDGVYSPRDPLTDAIVPTGIRYDAAALALMTDPVTLRITKPVDDVRDFAEKFIYAPTGWVPALDSSGRISPVSQAPPASLTGAVDINNGNTEPSPGWSAGERVVNIVTYKYPRYYTGGSDGDGLSRVDVTVEYRDAPSMQRNGDKKVEYDGAAFAAIGNTSGDAVTAQDNELGARLAADRRRHVLDRFRQGAQAIDVNVRRSSTASVAVGDWVTVDLSWFPSYVTGRRDMVTSGQVIAINELDCAWRRFLIEEGSALIGGTLPTPTLATTATSQAGVIPLPVLSVTLVVGGMLPTPTLSVTMTFA